LLTLDMRLATIIALGLLPLLNLAQAPPAFNADPPKVCDACDEWNKPRAPYKVFGNTYYVGTAGLSSVLVTSPAGHILLDGGLAQSASLIDRSIKTLGFATADVRYILASHGHYDHVGGVAALQRASGARVAVSTSTAQALERGENTPDDPQFGFGRAANAFPPVKNVQVVAGPRDRTSRRCDRDRAPDSRACARLDSLDLAIVRRRDLSEHRVCRQPHVRVRGGLQVFE
jgi:Metallo-beta-lactamase superfamily